MELKAIPNGPHEEGCNFLQSFFNETNTRFAEGLAKEMDDTIRKAFIEKNLSVDEDFIKEHCSCVTDMGDEFHHYWYHYGKADAIRIISIEKEPNISYTEEMGSVKMKADMRYY
jgi:hypothetical protein